MIAKSEVNSMVNWFCISGVGKMLMKGDNKGSVLLYNHFAKGELALAPKNFIINLSESEVSTKRRKTLIICAKRLFLIFFLY